MKKKHISKKYTIENEYLDGAVVADSIRFVYLKKIPGTRIVYGSISSGESRRNLSQLGTCYGGTYGRRMIFGDSLEKCHSGKWIGNFRTRTYRQVDFSSKLARFVRS